MVGGVDGPSFDAVCRLSGFQVDDVDQRFGAVPVPFHTLEKIILVRKTSQELRMLSRSLSVY